MSYGTKLTFLPTGYAQGYETYDEAPMRSTKGNPKNTIHKNKGKERKMRGQEFVRDKQMNLINALLSEINEEDFPEITLPTRKKHQRTRKAIQFKHLLPKPELPLQNV
jgi:hypothetical protein